MTHGTDSLRGDVRIERDAERGQVQVAVDASELLARLEHRGFIDLRVELIKGGMETSCVSENAIFMPGNVEPLYSQWLAFSGSTVEGRGHPELPVLRCTSRRPCSTSMSARPPTGLPKLTRDRRTEGQLL